ncbi:MAG: hypothetical protein HQ486_08705 [Acidimicrobiaceae bacterium]|nr:hypothetical protein [Acidimicrobiaceae bacterium]
MPKSIAEIILHADELAEACENFDMEKARPLSPEESLVMHAAVERGISDEDIMNAFTEARASGASWDQIGKALGISPQSAHLKYSALLDQ